MKVAKRFKWEAAHRLPWHEGQCKFVHGHSYRMMVELEGTPDDRGMLIDFKEIKRTLKPLIERWDHATLIAENDAYLKHAIIAAAEEHGVASKYDVLPYDTTAENLSTYVADYLGTEAYQTLQDHNVEAIRVTVYETETCYAEIERPVSRYANQSANGSTQTAVPTHA
jgi:6-pyruvoyltetrahydropterin/6-carboxytetrahydropterin synthase